jgi:uncharacterized repeat protein (TIGR01451 family)
LTITSNDPDENTVEVDLTGKGMDPNSPRADLGIEVSASPDKVRLTDTITYTVNVTNYGPNASTDVVATQFLPFSLPRNP